MNQHSPLFEHSKLPVVRTIFESRDSDPTLRLSEFESSVFGDVGGSCGNPRYQPLEHTHQAPIRHQRTKLGSFLATTTITSGYQHIGSKDVENFSNSHVYFCFCTEGQAHLDTTKQSLKISPGDMYVRLAKDFRIRFAPGVYERLVVPRSILNPKASCLDEFLVFNESNPITSVLHTATNSLNSLSASSHPAELATMSDVALTVSQRVVQSAISKSQQNGDEITLNKAIEYISNNVFRGDLSVHEVARSCGVSRASLYRAFDIYGGVAHYITSQRIEAAKRVLRSGPSCRGAITAACYSTGFTDPAHFSRLFKRHAGMLPSEYIMLCT